MGDFDATHILHSAHRATLQGWGEAKYPSEMTETKRRDLISQVVPPPFAAVLAEAVERTVKEETNRTTGVGPQGGEKELPVVQFRDGTLARDAVRDGDSRGATRA